ncbi:chromate transporter [Acidisoma cellulosilytica]|uniref:Chromate transporter n=1 Tax=Acidisoma cellulosilyticum TaxID=2802395 RepID=A0A963Z6Y9_9PROT|nr:chromate transporter [Acidisoma cellulosilyticum]MCB8883235.1 chromate transporter [Acidisoma cellulosilyticum]
MTPNSSTNDVAETEPNNPVSDETSGAAPAAPDEASPIRATAWEIVRTFNEISLSSFGGGLSAWSREMVVARRKWMNDAEFLSAMTICRILPGANQVNLAVFVGTKLNGLRGAGAALAGLIAMPTLLLVGIAALYAAFQHSHAVQHVLGGFAAAAVAMTLQMVWKTGRTTLTSIVPILLFALTFVLNGILRWPLWWTLAVTAPLGIGWAWRRAHRKAQARPPGAAS